MKTAIIATLVLFNVAAHADGFAPWNDRATPKETPDVAQVSATEGGFAPWYVDHFAPLNGVELDTRVIADQGSVFRPWS